MIIVLSWQIHNTTYVTVLSIIIFRCGRKILTEDEVILAHTLFYHSESTINRTVERKIQMPKVKLSERYSQKAPPIDWLWAAVLERKAVYGFDLKYMAKIAGISYDTMRRYIRVSPWTWEQKARERICTRFGIKPQIAVQMIPQELADKQEERS